MNRKKDIIKCIESISGKYSSYEVFSDWIKCCSISISNSMDLFRGKIWKDREQVFADTISRYSRSEQERKSTDLLELTPQQAKTKIEAWESEKEIKVGDVVTITNNDPTSITNGKTVHTGVITSAHPDNYYDLILGGGLAWSYVDGEKIKKTGRHIDIEGILKQIGGDE